LNSERRTNSIIEKKSIFSKRKSIFGKNEINIPSSRYGFVGNAGDLELDAPLSGEPV